MIRIVLDIYSSVEGCEKRLWLQFTLQIVTVVSHCQLRNQPECTAEH